jgi:SagB-type dehydrogenase family enzyme
VCYWDADGGRIFDSATGHTARLSLPTWQILDLCGAPRTVEDLHASLGGRVPCDLVARLVSSLLSAGFLVPADGSVTHPFVHWGQWNPAASFFHAVSRLGTYGDPAALDEALWEKAGSQPMPPSLKPPTDERISLPGVSLRNAFTKTVEDRRTWRRFGRRAVTLGALGTALHACAGITHWLRIPRLGEVPLTSSPSGGGRHPIEVYVLTLNVTGVPPGFYRYAGDRHELDCVRAGRPESVEALFPTQPWFASCGAVIFLSAVFARTQWRYDFARAYRAVMLEAGHVCQTFLLAATALRLAPFCTMAIDESLVEQALNLDGTNEAVMYAAGVGTRPRDRGRVIMPADASRPVVRRHRLPRQTHVSRGQR